VEGDGEEFVELRAGIGRAASRRGLGRCALVAMLVQACALDSRTFVPPDDARQGDAGTRFVDASRKQQGGGWRHAGVAGKGGGRDAGRDATDAPVENTGTDGASGDGASPPDDGGPDADVVVPPCCAPDETSDTCSILDEHCAGAEAARLSELEVWLRVVVRSGAFVECMSAVMGRGIHNLEAYAASVPSGGCAGISPPYEQEGHGPYVSCRPEADPRNGGVPGGDSRGDPAWNELPDRQLSRALNAAQLELALTRTPDLPGGRTRAAGYDPARGLSLVEYADPARELTFEDALGSVDDVSGFLPSSMRASASNLGYDDGCRTEAPLGTDHGNCGRDPSTWHPDRALDNIAGYCVKEVLRRSADDTNIGCGTEGSGARQTLRRCAQQGLIVVSRYGRGVSEASCHCVPDPVAFPASTQDDRFGAAVAVADFNNDGLHDLAVGVPNKLFPEAFGRGGVFIYRGSRIGLRPWRSFSSSDLGFDRDDAGCGATLAAGDLDNDGSSELVIGCPGFDAGSGRVAIVPGCATRCIDDLDGLQIERKQPLIPSMPGEFGHALAVGRFLGDDGLADLLVGSPSASGAVAITGRVEMYRGQAAGMPVEHAGTLEGVDTFDRFGAALAVGDVQSTPGNELLVGAPGWVTPATALASGGVFVVSMSTGTAAMAPLDSTLLPDGAGFGSALATGDLFGDEFDDIVITSPGDVPRLYRAIGAGARPGTADVVATYDRGLPATAVAVVLDHRYAVSGLVLVGQPGANMARLYRPSGSALAVDEPLGLDAFRFWSATHDPRDGGHCSLHGDLDLDVPCPIDGVALTSRALGSAVAWGDFGMGVQFVVGAPLDTVGGPQEIEAGAVYVRYGARNYDLDVGIFIDPLEYRLDQEATFYAATPYRRAFGPAVEWSDFACEVGETCTMRASVDGADAVVFSRDLPGKEGDVWVAESTGSGFGTFIRWHDDFCTGEQLCTVGDVNGDSDEDMIAFVRNAIPGHEHHVHVLRCAGCDFEEWNDDFCHAGSICLVGDAGGGTRGDDIIEINPQQGAQIIGFSSGSQASGFVVSGGVSSGSLCAVGHECLLADVTGDFLDDVVEFHQGSSGEVWVARATGSGFAPARRWHASFCTAGEQCRAGDVNGDLITDLVSFVREATPGRQGEVWVSLSNGVDFGPAELWRSDLCRGTQTCALGDVDTDTRSDAVVFIGPTPIAHAYDVNVAPSLP